LTKERSCGTFTTPSLSVIYFKLFPYCDTLPGCLQIVREILFSVARILSFLLQCWSNVTIAFTTGGSRQTCMMRRVWSWHWRRICVIAWRNCVQDAISPAPSASPANVAMNVGRWLAVLHHFWLHYQLYFHWGFCFKYIWGDYKWREQLHKFIGKKVIATQKLNSHHCKEQLIEVFSFPM